MSNKIFIHKKGDYDEHIDCLVRAYPNQSSEPVDGEEFCGEVLFKPHVNRQHEHFTAEFPRGVAYGCAGVINDVEEPLIIQVSNELPHTVGDLNYCDVHFDKRFKEKLNK